MEPGKSLRRVAAIARAEAFRTGGSFNKRTTAIMIAMGLAMAFLLPLITSNGIEFDSGIYRASVEPGAPLLPAMQASRLFQIFLSDDPISDVDAGAADIGVMGATIYGGTGGSKAEAAAAAIKQAAKDYTFTNLLDEDDQSAAFPVRVELRYEQQERPGSGGSAPTLTGIEPTTPTPGAEGSSGSVSGSGTGATGSAGEPLPQQANSGFSFLPPERSINTPETLSPPFPFRSLLLAYVFLIPMNFVVQVYAGSAISERLNRRGEAMLASPARHWEIIAGKALPYFLLMMLLAGIIAWKIGGTWLSLLAVAPLALAFLALEFVSAMFARSFRELTFLTVFTSVLITIYAFLPAVFTSVHPVALVSPIALVVFDLRHEAVTVGQVLYATLPLTLFSGMLFILGAALYREEDLFHQKPVLAKAVDAVARQVKGMASGIKLSFLLIPLVFVVELLLVTFLFAWPVSTGVLGVLLAVAFTEETFKAVPSYAAVRRGRIPLKRAVAFGALVGLGFFLAEKGFLLASLVGLLDVPAAAAVFGTGGAAASNASWLILGALLLGPLLLHTTTAALTGWGAKEGKRTFALSFLLAIGIHTTYNYAVIAFFGGLP